MHATSAAGSISTINKNSKNAVNYSSNSNSNSSIISRMISDQSWDDGEILNLFQAAVSSHKRKVGVASLGVESL